MRLFDPRTGEEPTTPEGATRLQAERRWLAEGTPDEIDGAGAELGRVATRLTPTLLELSFGNAVGWYAAGPLGDLEVVSGKWGDEHFRAMLEQLTGIAASLPFSAGTPSALPFERDEVGSEDVLYHAFTYLRHLVGSPAGPGLELVGPLRSVLARPHRRTTRGARVVPIGLARRVAPDALLGMAAGRWPMRRSDRVALARFMRGMIPEEVEESVLAADVDTPENRFVRSLLELCRLVIDRVRELAGRHGCLGPQTRAYCDYIESVLRPLIDHPLWSQVGRMTHFPAASTVLQRRHDYRALFTHYNRLRLGSRVPLDAEDAELLLEAKDVARLYEVWTCFAFIDAAKPVLGQPVEVRRPSVSDVEATVAWKMQARWADGTMLHYNPTFTRSAGGGLRSYSLLLRPDLMLTVPGGPNAGRHVFDAKFKLEGGPEDEAAGFKREDLHKMHAYRDALDGVRSAWVLYPGSSFRFFRTCGMDVDSAESLPEVFDGVGGVPLAPGEQPQALIALLALMCPNSTTESAARPIKPPPLQEAM